MDVSTKERQLFIVTSKIIYYKQLETDVLYYHNIQNEKHKLKSRFTFINKYKTFENRPVFTAMFVWLIWYINQHFIEFDVIPMIPR